MAYSSLSLSCGVAPGEPRSPSIVVSIALAVGGWVSAHYFTSQRDQGNKRRDIRLERLLKCYDSLAKEIAHRKLGDQQKLDFENALIELQLIGTENLIELASTFNVDDNHGSIVPILEMLRAEVRRELGLSKTKLPFMWFRFQTSERWKYREQTQSS